MEIIIVVIALIGLWIVGLLYEIVKKLSYMNSNLTYLHFIADKIGSINYILEQKTGIKGKNTEEQLQDAWDGIHKIAETYKKEERESGQEEKQK